MIKNNFTKLNNLVKHYNTSSVVQSNIIHMFKGDIGATNHYVAPIAQSTLINITPNNTVNVTLADNSNIKSTYTGHLNIPQLSNTATSAHILLALKDTSLLLLGQLANDDCHILLNKQTLKVFKNFKLILQGFRNRQDGIWDVPIPSITNEQTKSLQQQT